MNNFEELNNQELQNTKGGGKANEMTDKMVCDDCLVQKLK